jgi:hypothetical protein
MLVYTVEHIIEICFYFLYFTLLGIILKIILKEKTKNIVHLNLMGIFLSIMLLSIWNLFFPIKLYFAFIFSTVILISFYFIFRNKDSIKFSWINSKYLFFLFLQFGFIVWISNRSLSGLKYEPMYQIQKIRWAQEYHIVKGLGNLFDHLGLDSSNFLQLAFYDSFPFIQWTFWNYSGYLLALGSLYFFVIPIYEIYITKSEIKYSQIMKLLFVPILIHNCFYLHPGIGTDLPVFIFGSIFAVELFKLFIEKKYNLSITLICLVLGFSSKMSFLPTLALSICSLLTYFYLKLDISIKLSKTILWLSFIFLSIHIYSNILLTGYPFYPSSIVSIPVQWKMEKAEVENLSKGISNWAKGIRGDLDLNNKALVKKTKKEWIKSRLFLAHRRVETLYPLILGIIGILYIFINKRKLLIKIGIFIIPVIGQIGLWLFYSPDTRFASFAFWWFGAGLATFPIKVVLSKKIGQIFPIILILASFSIHKVDSLGQEKDLLIYKNSNVSLKIPRVIQYSLGNKLNVWVPENGGKCHDAPLPCTQSPDKNLKLLNSLNIQGGFFK